MKDLELHARILARIKKPLNQLRHTFERQARNRLVTQQAERTVVCAWRNIKIEGNAGNLHIAPHCDTLIYGVQSYSP
jgi:hypothetical protein